MSSLHSNGIASNFYTSVVRAGGHREITNIGKAVERRNNKKWRGSVRKSGRSGGRHYGWGERRGERE